MIPLAQLKQNLEFNKSFGEIVDVLKIAASVRLRQFQMKTKPYEEFFRKLQSCLNILAEEERKHPFLQPQSKKTSSCIVVVTSDEGFAGELNTLLINTALDCRENPDVDEIVVLGERGSNYLEDMNQSFTFFPGVSEDIETKEIERLEEYVIGEYLEGKFSKVLIVYAKFINITSQRVEKKEILPCNFLFEKKKSGDKKIGDLLIEPSFDKVLEGLVRLWLGWVIYNIFWSSKLSELSARLMHLEGSTQELARINQNLSLQYFRYLHALADKSIREISASRLVDKG